MELIGINEDSSGLYRIYRDGDFLVTHTGAVRTRCSNWPDNRSPPLRSTRLILKTTGTGMGQMVTRATSISRPHMHASMG